MGDPLVRSWGQGWIGRVDRSGKSSALSSDPLNKPQQGQVLKLGFGGHIEVHALRELMEDFL